MSETEKIISLLGDQINSLQAQTIREIGALTKHGVGYINLEVRVDGRDYNFEADWLANLLNPRGPVGTQLDWKRP